MDWQAIQTVAWTLVKIMALVIPLMLAVAYLTYAERRIIGWMQVRIGQISHRQHQRNDQRHDLDQSPRDGLYRLPIHQACSAVMGPNIGPRFAVSG